MNLKKLIIIFLCFILSFSLFLVGGNPNVELLTQKDIYDAYKDHI